MEKFALTCFDKVKNNPQAVTAFGCTAIFCWTLKSIASDLIKNDYKFHFGSVLISK